MGIFINWYAGYFWEGEHIRRYRWNGNLLAAPGPGNQYSSQVTALLPSNNTQDEEALTHEPVHGHHEHDRHLLLPLAHVLGAVQLELKAEHLPRHVKSVLCGYSKMTTLQLGLDLPTVVLTSLQLDKHHTQLQVLELLNVQAPTLCTSDPNGENLLEINSGIKNSEISHL